MARSTQTKTPSPNGTLRGKTFAFVGKFGYRDWSRKQYEGYALAAGAKLVDPFATEPHYVVAGDGRGGKPPGDVAKIEQKHPTVSVMDLSAFMRLIAPGREELLREIRSGKLTHERWEALSAAIVGAGVVPDLSKSDLRGTDLMAAHLSNMTLDGSDLRTASMHFAQFGSLKRVKFDEADAQHVYLMNLEACTFRQANLEHAWLFYNNATTVKGCDFTGARLAKASAEEGEFVDCKFSGVDLSDAQIEKTSFRKADLTKVNLTRAHASGCKFDDAILSRATLHRADLRGASLVRTDLRNADLREAVLSGADFTGARVEGADFAGAVLTGAKVTRVDLSKAKNFVEPVVRKPGPALREFAQAAAGAKDFVTSAEVDFGPGEHAELSLYAEVTSGRRLKVDAISRYQHDEDNDVRDRIDAPSVEQGMLNLAERWPYATLRFDTISAKGSPSVRGKKLQDLALAAWAEAFGVQSASPEALHEKKAAQKAGVQALRETMLAELHAGPAGVKKWNARSERERDQVGSFHELKLVRAKLSGVDLGKRDLTGSTFEGATLKKANLWSTVLTSANFASANLAGSRLDHARCERASFAAANLAKCSLSIADLRGADFRRADLTGAALDFASLQGADLTGAKVKGVEFKGAYYDATTCFPAGFTPDDSMTLEFPPHVPATPSPVAAGSLDFDAFAQRLAERIEPARLSKATAMLKAERFQLFAEAKDDSIVGIVKSQSSAERVYSCRLAADGAFACCTQNLRPCGGLSGAVCKHLLVLIVGLAKAGRIDPATVDAWIHASQSRKPALDADVMSESFLRYKGAEAGEIDWRPTETIPEDFYAL